MTLERKCMTFSRGASAVAALVGFLVLIGWALDVEMLKAVVPGLVAMNPITALAFILAGAALWILRKEEVDSWMRRLGLACASIVALVGLLRLGAYLFGWETGIDQLLFPERLDTNRMAPNTALNFLLLGAALLLLDVETRRGHWPAQFLTFTATLISFASVLGYTYGAAFFYTVASYIPMALNTTLAFLALSAGLLCARPDRGLMAIVTSESAGGILARRLLLAAIGVPPVLGWLRLAGQRVGLYGTEAGIALLVGTVIVAFTALIWWTAEAVHRADALRNRAQEERNRFFVLSQDMLCTAGFDGYFKALSPSWEKTLGYTKEELLAKPYLEFIHPEDREKTLAEAEKISEGHTTLSFENRYRCKDGSCRWFLWTATPVLEDRLMYAAARDVTERKRTEEQIKKSNEQLEVANKELEAFSYSVSHDLRAPLRHIDGFSSLLQKHAAALDEKGRRHLATISDSAKQMGRLIDDLLLFSRTGRAELHMTPVNLANLVKEVQQALKPDTPGREVTWTIGTLPEVHGDPSMLRQVLANLIGNAVKYTSKRENARIEVGCENANSSDKEVVIYVKDNGAGFDQQYAHKLFGVFQRLHSAGEFEGTGIGLANVRRIIQRHGGRTWAEGTVNEGATFYFSLPTSNGGTDERLQTHPAG